MAKYVNTAGRTYTFLRAKGNLMAAWTAKIEKPVKVKIDGETVEIFANQEKSDYIYFKHKGTVYCVWAKDPKEFDFLKETSLKLSSEGRAPRKAKAATEKPATKAKGSPTAKSPAANSKSQQVTTNFKKEKKAKAPKVNRAPKGGPATEGAPAS